MLGKEGDKIEKKIIITDHPYGKYCAIQDIAFVLKHSKLTHDEE